MTEKYTNSQIARLFRQVAAAYTIKEKSRFRIIAYDKAAEIVEKSNVDIKDLWRQGSLDRLPGIGKTIAQHLNELFTTGKVKQYQKAFENLPAGMFTLLDVPGIGPKTAFRLSKQFNLKNRETAVEKLLTQAKHGKIAPLEGFGEKSQQDLIEALENFKKGNKKSTRMNLPYANNTAQNVLKYLRGNPYTIIAEPLGSLRRRVATVGDIDIAVSTRQPQKLIDNFLNYAKTSKIIEQGPSGATIILDTGQHIDLRVSKPESFGAMLQYFTGSKSHNIHLRELAIKNGLSLSEYGIKKTNKVKRIKVNYGKYNKRDDIYEYDSEKEFYQELGLQFIPPELREDEGEIEKAQKNILPQLIKAEDLKGEVHVHSDYDLNPSHDLGSSSLVDILYKARERNYQYIGISDHNPSHTNLSENKIMSIMKTRKENFEHILSSNKNVRVNLFIMLEVDILPDGNLALPDKVFQYIDACVVSIHSRFDMPKEKMTERIIKGLENDKAKILGHPTGRLLGKRTGFEADWQKIFNFCKVYDKALEINSYPDRLDLPDMLVKLAVENGNKLIIDTDSHHKDQMDLIEYGVSVARRGWAEKNDILNTLPYDRFNAWLTGGNKKGR